MKYQQKLKSAADSILTADSRASHAYLSNPADIGVTATLKPHQVEGVDWLIKKYLTGVNVILGDEMGLGKTLQAISFLCYLKAQKLCTGPFLVLCPLSVTDGWVSEIANFSPTLKLLRYIGDKEERRHIRRTMSEHVNNQLSLHGGTPLPFDVLLTSYDTALIDQGFLSQFSWHYAIVDEAQRLKNPSSVLYNVLKERFLMPRRLLITGTPIQNNLSELWALLNFCMPLIFGTREQFLMTFKEAGMPSGHNNVKFKEQTKTLKYILGAFMLRRTKSKLIESGTLSLPSLTEITVIVPMVALQKKVYTSILRKELSELIACSSGAHNHQSLQNIVMQLRKACSHPYLFPGIEPEPYEEGEHLVQASGKLIVLDELLRKLRSAGHRILLFAQMTHTLDILQDFLELRKYSYERLDGSVRAEERFVAIRSFSRKSTPSSTDSEADQSNAFIFLISTRAGGVGLNLVAADTVIFFEQDWNPQVDKQALQRAHRIGQMNHVLSLNIVTGRSVEEVIMRRARRKLQLSHNVVGEDDMVRERKELEGPDPGDLRSIIFGLHVFDPSNDNSGNLCEVNMSELNAMADRVISMRYEQKTVTDDSKFEINPMDLIYGGNISLQTNSESCDFDPGLDEASYCSWVEKFKDDSESMDSKFELKGKRHLPEEKQLQLEASRKKSEEKKLSKWEALGYQSLSVKDPIFSMNDEMMENTASVNFVYGDCTDPSKVCPNEPAIIFSCVDNSGNWGNGGMFEALARISSCVPDAYKRAFEFDDLHLGDLHLIRINDDYSNQDAGDDIPLWVALAVVQSYNPRRKVSRSNISIPDLERCLLKAASMGAENSASIHMPRIGYQTGSERSEWYTVERLLRKYSSMFGIKIFVEDSSNLYKIKGGVNKRVFDSSQELKKGAKSMNKNQAGNDAVDETGKDEDDNDDTTHARFSLSLTRKEIQEDFLRITGSMPPKKPNKRAKPVQMALSAASPGGTLRSAKLEKYKVNKTRAKAKKYMLW